MEKSTTYCDVCKKNIRGGRTMIHATKREHLKLLIEKFRKAKIILEEL